MEQQDIDVFGSQLASKAIKIGSSLVGGDRAGLCKDGYTLARDILECFTHVRMGAVPDPRYPIR